MTTIGENKTKQNPCVDQRTSEADAWAPQCFFCPLLFFHGSGFTLRSLVSAALPSALLSPFSSLLIAANYLLNTSFVTSVLLLMSCGFRLPTNEFQTAYLIARILLWSNFIVRSLAHRPITHLLTTPCDATPTYFAFYLSLSVFSLSQPNPHSFQCASFS